jgi:hypothetical protein
MTLVPEQVLTELAIHIIKEVSRKAKIDPDELASCIPGLVHSHWYIADAPVDGCLFCRRRRSAT